MVFMTLFYVVCVYSVVRNCIYYENAVYRL